MGFHTPVFFAVTVAAFCLYWTIRGRKLLVLALFDCLFYLYAGILDFGLFFGASIVSYFSARGMRGRHKKGWAALGIALNVLNLAFFKYYYFILGNIEKVMKGSAPFSGLKVVLPIGISFYTFQLIAYLVDVYKGQIEPVESFVDFWVFISFFGQVIAGPIMRAKDFVPQVEAAEGFSLEAERVRKGLLLFGLGLAKKLILADTLSPFVDKYFSKGLALSSIDVWVAAYLFAFQIYYDFSAYSDMALGLGHLFGFTLTRNFDTPYLSQNPPEFWKRWHITLSSWVRDYLYIPMGGSRKGFARGLLAVVVAMCISGLWHGASWTFVLWGLYHGLLSALHRVWKRAMGQHARPEPRPAIQALSVFGFMQLTVIGWVFFRVTNVRELWPLLARMLTFSHPGSGPHLAFYIALIIGLYLLHVIEYLARKHVSELRGWWGSRIPAPVRGLAYAVVVLVLGVFLRPKVNAFIYFQF